MLSKGRCLLHTQERADRGGAGVTRKAAAAPASALTGARVPVPTERQAALITKDSGVGEREGCWPPRK